MNPLTNRITTAGYGYDGNGNMTQAPGATYRYDIAGRLVSNGAVYNGKNQRVWDGTNLYLYDLSGRLYGKYSPVWTMVPPASEAQLQGGQVNLYFRGIAVYLQGHGNVVTDRVGSVRANSQGGRFSYYPYGGKIGTETTDTGQSRKVANFLLAWWTRKRAADSI